jgi:hypothetical protein
MFRGNFIVCVLLALAAGAPAQAQNVARLSATEIVQKNLAARGGLSRWQNLKTMSWSGKLEAGGPNEAINNFFRSVKIPGAAPVPPPSDQPVAQPQLPFQLDLMRGRKSRLEIQFAGETAVQVYDGKEGWKVRPYLNRNDVEPYTADELALAANQADLDGELVDYAAKGTTVAVEGIEKVEGRDAYKLKLTLKNKQVVYDWIDAQSFLEVKIDGSPRKLDGHEHAVSVYMRDYREVDGLKIPHVLETVVEGVKRTERILIDKVEVNPAIDASRFTKPTVGG